MQTARKVVGGQCRHPGVDHPAPRPGWRPAVPAGQGGATVGPRQIPGRPGVHEPGRTRRDRATADTGGRRHLPRLAAGSRHRWRGAGLLRPPTARSKGSAVIEAMNPDTMALYGRLCARALAYAHARAGDRFAIAGYLDSDDDFDEALTAFAETYADQNERDHTALRKAIDDGRIAAHQGA
ncbi:hypothetical protein OPAG_07419 [Rhodococcus opacus PD630]|nr:hypothetical protein OPAG_07419 [Rhodococcus opacus PD630]